MCTRPKRKVRMISTELKNSLQPRNSLMLFSHHRVSSNLKNRILRNWSGKTQSLMKSLWICSFHPMLRAWEILRKSVMIMLGREYRKLSTNRHFSIKKFLPLMLSLIIFKSVISYLLSLLWLKTKRIFSGYLKTSSIILSESTSWTWGRKEWSRKLLSMTMSL